MKAAALILCATLAGCATAPRGNFCDVAEAIRPSVEDKLSDGTARQILRHNEFGAATCGWGAAK